MARKGQQTTTTTEKPFLPYQVLYKLWGNDTHSFAAATPNTAVKFAADIKAKGGNTVMINKYDGENWVLDEALTNRADSRNHSKGNPMAANQLKQLGEYNTVLAKQAGTTKGVDGMLVARWATQFFQVCHSLRVAPSVLEGMLSDEWFIEQQQTTEPEFQEVP